MELRLDKEDSQVREGLTIEKVGLTYWKLKRVEKLVGTWMLTRVDV